MQGQQTIERFSSNYFGPKAIKNIMRSEDDSILLITIVIVIKDE